jgi:glycosyltransferase involved in cell wall biosynthesis
MARNSDLLAEAMRAGQPCIGTYGAAEEIIEHGVFGYVMNPSSPDDLFD